jgi:hypothetical protein
MQPPSPPFFTAVLQALFAWGNEVAETVSQEICETGRPVFWWRAVHADRPV